MRSLGTFALVAAFGVAAPADLTPVASADEPTAAAPGASTPESVAGPAPAVTQAPTEPPQSSRPGPPAAPRKYLEAGAMLFNTRRFDLAATYLRAAHVYRDGLTESERIVLDVYREKLARYQKAAGPVAVATAPTDPNPAPRSADPGVVTAGMVGGSVVDPVKALTRRPDPLEAEILKALAAPAPAGTDSPEGDGALPTEAQAGTAKIRGTAAWRDTTDTKQKARWLLQLAREQILKENFEVAAQAIAEAQGMNIKWTVFDETPERVAESLEKARGKAGARPSGDPGAPRDRKAAKAELKVARAALQAGELDRAEQIVREVKSWGVGYNLFDDTPERVAAAVYEARRREAVRNAESMVKSYYLGGGQAAPTHPAAGDGPAALPGLPSPTR